MNNKQAKIWKEAVVA